MYFLECTMEDTKMKQKNSVKKTRKKLHMSKKAILIFVVFLFVSLIIQFFFMPKWYDGNTDYPQKAEVGVHEQQSEVSINQGVEIEVFGESNV